MFRVKRILNCDCGGESWFTRQSGSNKSIIEKCIEHDMHRDIQCKLHCTLLNNKQRCSKQIIRNRWVWLEWLEWLVDIMIVVLLVIVF